MFNLAIVEFIELTSKSKRLDLFVEEAVLAGSMVVELTLPQS